MTDTDTTQTRSRLLGDRSAMGTGHDNPAPRPFHEGEHTPPKCAESDAHVGVRMPKEASVATPGPPRSSSPIRADAVATDSA